MGEFHWPELTFNFSFMFSWYFFHVQYSVSNIDRWKQDWSSTTDIQMKQSETHLETIVSSAMKGTHIMEVKKNPALSTTCDPHCLQSSKQPVWAGLKGCVLIR
jgi:hypothetical protein